jgi:hypothetical protein
VHARESEDLRTRRPTHRRRAGRQPATAPRRPSTPPRSRWLRRRPPWTSPTPTASGGRSTGPGVEHLVTEAVAGIADVEAAPVPEQTRRTVYDGITADELALAPVMAARSLVESEPHYSAVAARLLLDRLRTEALSHLTGARTAGDPRRDDRAVPAVLPRLPAAGRGAGAGRPRPAHLRPGPGHRRARQIGLAPLHGEPENPILWTEAMDLKKEKNFFETRVIEYRTGGGLDWD